MKCFGKDRQGRHTFPTDVPHFLNTCYMLLIKKILQYFTEDITMTTVAFLMGAIHFHLMIFM